MHSPRGRGAGLVGAVSLAILLCVLALGASPAFASHHQTDAGGSEPARVIVIDARTDTILVGGQVRLDVSRCEADGSNCKPAGKAKVTAQPKGVVNPNKGSGAQVLFTAKKPGTVTFTATQGDATGTFTLQVNEPPDRSGGSDETTAEPLRLFIDPEESVSGEGGEARFTAWGCPLEDGTRVGPNGVPDGLDDACTTVPIEQVNIDAGAPITLRALQGPTVVLRFNGFPTSEGGDLVFLGAQVVTPLGGTLPSWQGERSPESDPLFYDMNMDGVIDQDDDDILTGGLPGDDLPLPATDPGFDPLFDINRDRILDTQDHEMFRALIQGAVDAGAPRDGADRADLDDDGSVTRADYDTWLDVTWDMDLPLDAAGSRADVDGDGIVGDGDGRAILE